jgi:hypothetical protein
LDLGSASFTISEGLIQSLLLLGYLFHQLNISTSSPPNSSLRPFLLFTPNKPHRVTQSRLSIAIDISIELERGSLNLRNEKLSTQLTRVRARKKSERSERSAEVRYDSECPPNLFFLFLLFGVNADSLSVLTCLMPHCLER